MESIIATKMNKLCEKIKNQSVDDVQMELELIEEAGKDCSEYVKKVVDMEHAVNVARFRLEGQDYRDYITELDKARRAVHNVVISDIKVLNRLSMLHSLPLLFEGNVNDRIEVGEFAKALVDEYFANREK